MVIVMRRPIAATRLLMAVDDYWVTMILEYGIEGNQSIVRKFSVPGF